MAPVLLIAIAAVQGLTEFLPVSSSGHLTLAAEVFDLDLHGSARAAFFVLLHFASLLAIVVWLRRDLWALVHMQGRRPMLLAIALGCLPAGVAGVLLKVGGAEERLFESLPLVGMAWIATALLLWATRRRDDEGEDGGWSIAAREPFPTWQILAIGAAQAFAIVPGISRAGATIAVALLLGMGRRASFRFSFLIALPTIAGATLLEIGSLGDLAQAAGPGTLAAAFAVAFATSLAALALLEGLVVRRRLHWFTPYCLALGAGTLVWVALR